MGITHIYEEHFLGIARFLESAQARRFLTLAKGSDKHVQKALNLFDCLTPVNADLLKGIEAGSDSVFKKLKSLGAPDTCVVFSQNSWDMNGEVSLVEALAEIVHHKPGTVISCVPGVLGFWETFEIGHRYILKE